MKLLLALAFWLVVTPAWAQVSFGFAQRGVSVSVAQNVVEKNLETQRFLWADVGPVLVGFVGINHAKPDALAIATLPLRVWFWRVHVEGGGWLGTAAVPSFGTRANFAARLRVSLTRTLQVSWLHLSNASLGANNPASDAIGLTWGLR